MAKIIGIDLAGLEKNDTGFCVFEEKNTTLKILHSNEEILNEIEKENPDIICIDGPTTLPMHNLRKCDLELKKYGILPPLLGGMRYLTMRATKLREILEKKYRVIEIFPTATAKILGFYDPDPAKRQEELIKLGIKGDVEKRALTKDEIDAVIAAVTGYLHLQGKTEEIGNEEGTIVTPKV